MTKKKILAAMALSTVLGVGALQAQDRAWTLDECLSYAREHNITVLLRGEDVNTARLGVTEAQDGWLPNVSASASQQWNLGRGLTSENVYANRNTSSFNWGASLDLPLFDGLSAHRRTEYARANLSQITEQYEAAKDDISINIITGYLQILYQAEMVNVQKTQVALSEYQLERQQALLSAGKIPEVDMLEAKAQLASDQLALTDAENEAQLARLSLANLLQLSPEEATTFDVTPISVDPGLIMSVDDAFASAMTHNHTVRAARLGIDAQERNIDVAKTGYMPRLSFNAGIGSTYYNVSGYPNEPFGPQMRHNFSTYLGFALRIPLFDAFSTRNSVRRAQAGKTAAALQLDQATTKLYYDIAQAQHQAVAAAHRVDAAIVAEQTASAAFDAMTEKYGIGRATPTEYQQSKAKALRATAERISAQYAKALRVRILNFYANPNK